MVWGDTVPVTSGRYHRVAGPPPEAVPLPTPLVERPVDAGDGAGRGSLVLVHGGFWRARWDRDHARPQARALAALGWHVALPEYRRAGMPGGGWPGSRDDVVEQVAALLAPDSPLPPGPVALVGHSAGGHLALLAAHALAARAPDRLLGVVVLAGVADLRLADDLRLGAGAVRELFGGLGSDLPRPVPPDSDPVRLGRLRLPVHLVHGTADRDVPESVSRSYATAVGLDPRHLHVLDGVGHLDLITPGTSGFDAVTAVLRALPWPA